MSLFLSSVNNQKKAARRRASIGGVDSNNCDHFLKGVAVATLPNVLDLPDPPTPPPPPLDVRVGNHSRCHPHQLQPEQWQPPPKKRRRRHSMSPCLSAKQNHPQHQHQHEYQHQHQHDNSKPLVFPAKETETADTDTNNTPSEPEAQALLQKQQQPLHPQQAPTMESMRPVLGRLRPAVHAYLEAYGQALDVAQQQQQQQQHPNNNNNNNNTDHWERVQQLQLELLHATTTKRHSHCSYNYVVNPPWLPTRLATTTIPCTATSMNMNSTMKHNDDKDPQTDDHQRRRRWARMWQHWAPAFQQLQQHQQATAATTARVTGITVHKPQDLGGGSNCTSRRERGSNYVYQSWSERDQHFVTVSPRVYERQYSRMLEDNNIDIKPNWKEYFDQLRQADAQEMKAQPTILDNAATTTTRPPPATCDKENAASVNTAMDSTTANNNSTEKLRALAMRPVGKMCRNSPRHPLPNRALAVLSTASSPAPTITRPSPDTKTHLPIPQNESGEVLLAQLTGSPALGKLASHSAPATAGTTAASLVNGTGNSNSKDDGENENIQNDNIRSTVDSNNNHHSNSTDRRENIADHDNHDDDLDDFWLQPIPDREAPSQHPEIAAAEERLFRALDTALETYSRQVIEIHRRDESAAQGSKKIVQSNQRD